MPITIEWDNEAHTILLHTYVGKWMLAEYDAAAAQAREMVVQEGHPVYYIIDLVRSAAPPLGVAARVVRATEGRTANEGLTILVGLKQQPMLAMLADQGSRLFPHLRLTYQFADSLDEARQMLTDVTATSQANSPQRYPQA